MNGILLIDKPAGPTSHDMVYRARRLCGTRRVGHAGTLDPFATGLLVMLIGQATKLSSYLIAQEKQYGATVAWGAATDTLDHTGTVVENTDVPFPNREDLTATLAAFVGESEQVPPMYSAKKVNGQALHQLARRGQSIERESRSVAIHDLELTDVDAVAGTFSFRVRCSKGTYIRVLAEDIAKRLGGLGHLTELRRERSGAFSLDDALTFEQAEALAARGELAGRLVSLNDALTGYPVVAVDAEAAAVLAHGVCPRGNQVQAADTFGPGDTVRLTGPGGELLALAAALADATELPTLAADQPAFSLVRVFPAVTAELAVKKHSMGFIDPDKESK